MRWLVEAFGGCWHAWAKWETHDFRKHAGGQSIIVTRQMRRCGKCGRYQLAELEP